MALSPSRADILNSTHSDGGPLYVETHFGQLLVEPFNAITAGLFLVLAVYWIIRLWHDASRQIFVLSCLVLLAVGGVGGSLYHALRSSRIFFLMDVLPIALLCAFVSLFYWRKIVRSWVTVLIFWSPAFLAQRWFFRFLAKQHAATISYVVLAVLILIPLVVYLYRTNYRYIDRVLYAVAFFAVGLFFRFADAYSAAYIPIGTHWLWHSFSAVAVYFLIDYVRRCAVHPPAYRMPVDASH